MTWRPTFARVPGILWVCLFVLVLAGAAAYAIYAKGETAGAVKAHRVALRDSVRTQRAAVEVIVARADNQVTRAANLRTASDNGRRAVRAVLEDTSQHAPPSLIAIVAEQLARDSLTIAVQADAVSLLLEERGARIELDTLQRHELVLRPPDAGGLTPLDVVKDVAVVLVVLKVVQWLLQLVRGP